MSEAAGSWTTVGHHSFEESVDPPTFAEYYRSTFGTTSITFESTRIDRIITQQCLTSNIQQRKFLVLYCHNEGDQFGQDVCLDWFKNSPVEHKLTHAKCVVVGYNITSTTDRGILISLMRMVMNNEELDNQVYATIRTGNSQIYVFVPFLNKMTTQSYIDETMSKDAAIEMLNYVTSLIGQIQKQHCDDMRSVDETQTCITFQQIMMTRLGNRDFDVFFIEQHVELKNKIAFAHFGPPQNEDGTYTSKQDKIIENTYKAIMTQSDKHTSNYGTVIISFIYVCCVEYTTSDIPGMVNLQRSNFYPVPIFVLRKCFHNAAYSLVPANANYCRVIIDNTLRVYTSWNKFILENKYGKCVLCVPTNGQYDCNDSGDVLTELHYSPACKMAQTTLRVLDKTASVAGLGSGALLVAAAIPAVTLAPVIMLGAISTGIGVGIYSIFRSVANLVDRAEHEENLSITEAESRAAYINIIAGSLGFVGAGASGLLTTLARNGTNVGKGAVLTMNALSKATIAAGGIALGNSTCDVIYNYVVHDQKPTPLMLVQLSASVLFFGNSVRTYKCASLMVKDAQTGRIQEMEGALRSNRHRKMFTKMQKETIRMSNGDGNVGRAKVISTVRNWNNVDEAMAILTRNNKRFNEMGIKFSADKGQVSINGQTMDIGMFSKATNIEHIREVMALPMDKIPDGTYKFSITFTKAEFGAAFLKVMTSSSVEQGVYTALELFAPFAQHIIIKLIKVVITHDWNNSNGNSIRTLLEQWKMDVDMVHYVINFLYNEAVNSLNLAKMVEKNCASVQILVNHFLCGRSITEVLVTKLVNYLTQVIAGKTMEDCRAATERKRIVGVRSCTKCSECPGYYHIKSYKV